MKHIKKIIGFVMVVVLCIQFGTVAEAKEKRATQDMDYAITYQYFNVNEEHGYVKYQAII